LIDWQAHLHAIGPEIEARLRHVVDKAAVVLGEECPALEAVKAPLGINPQVSFVGEVTNAQPRMLRHAANAFVLPSIDRREAFGIAQLETMACSRERLTGGNAFFKRHDVTGLLIPPGDPVALAAALNRLLSDQALRQRFGRTARARVEHEFGVEQMVTRTMQRDQDVLT
jgi:glycosyltransferase involved in cell wall biosynthesis